MAAVLALTVVVGVLGFVTPGYFVTTVLDRVAVQDGVRTVLERDYQLSRVTDVACPPDQRVAPTNTFVCTAQIDGVRSEVPVVIQDRDGRYAVGRPS